MSQSAVYRRRQIDNAKRKGENLVKAELLPVLQSRYKSLSRELRQGNLRKRLHKDELTLQKAAGDTWKSWFGLFDKTLKKSLGTGAGYLWDTETKYFVSMNYPTFPFKADDVLDAYQARVGTQITNISANTETYVNQAITDWYKTDQGLPDLIGMLEQFFSPARAELIATTEMAYVASQVSLEMMNNYDIEYWQWDAFNEERTCDECMDLMAQSKQKPFTKDDPMPPQHPACRCGTYWIGVDVNIKKFIGADLLKGGIGSGNFNHSGRIGQRGGSGGGGMLGGGAGVRRFDNTRQMKYYMDEEFDAWEQGLNTDESMAIRWYTGTGYEEINEALREGRELELETKWIDSALKKSPGFKEDTVVFRGLTGDPMLDTGDEFTDKGYISTSINPVVAEGFANQDAIGGGVMFEINVPKGHPAAYVSDIGGNSSEFETILPRDTQLRITGSHTIDTYNQMTLKVYEAEVIPQGK